MQNVDQYSTLSYSYPQLPTEIQSQVANYIPGTSYPSTIAVDAQCLTPPLEGPAGAFPRGFPAQLPTPPPSPPSFAKLNPFNTRQPQPSYTTASNSTRWSNYLDPGHRLQFQKVLGSGAYGIVHLAQDVSTGIHYAVKALNKFMPNGLPLDRRQQMFQQTEMRLHWKVSRHPNIVSLLRIMDAPEHTYVIMEYCPEGDLFSNITERGRYVGDDAAAKDIFLQILDAVSHCHSQGVYHRDLKPENILVTQGGRQVKLADFGLATQQDYATEFGCGSTFYMSPECQDQSSGAACYACAPNDIWSLGVILVNLTCGRNPWKSASMKDSTYRAYLQDRHFLKSILPLSDELNEILGMIFEPAPTQRIKLPDLRERIINCQQFTRRPEVPTPVYVSPPSPAYQESAALSPASTISDEGSMISDHSDDSTVPSEVDPASEEDFSSFEVMQEDCDFNLEPAIPGSVPVPEASPQPKLLPKVWEVDSVVPVVRNTTFQDSLQSYVAPPRSSNPFDYTGTCNPPPPQVAQASPSVPFVFNAPVPVKPVGSRQPVAPPPANHPHPHPHPHPHHDPRAASFFPVHHIHQHHGTMVAQPISQLRGSSHLVPPHHHGPASRTPTWPTAKRSYPRERATMRALHQWHQSQLREFLGHFPNPNRIY